MKFHCLDNIDEETKIVRLIDINAARPSVGIYEHGHVKYSLPINLLSYYKTCEGKQSDPMEGKTPIYFGDGKGGFSSSLNDALVSCWSIYKDEIDPWSDLKGSTFSDRKINRYAIVSTA